MLWRCYPSTSIFITPNCMPKMYFWGPNFVISLEVRISHLCAAKISKRHVFGPPGHTCGVPQGAQRILRDAQRPWREPEGTAREPKGPQVVTKVAPGSPKGPPKQAKGSLWITKFPWELDAPPQKRARLHPLHSEARNLMPNTQKKRNQRTPAPIKHVLLRAFGTIEL